MAWVVRGEFRKLWLGQLVSASGSAITTVALPLVAVVTLQASPVQMGALAALTIAPHLVFGLLVGVWVDRWSLRRVLIWTDIGRLVLLSSVPVAAALDSLRIEQLYVVAVLTGVLTLLSDTASQTLIPSLVPREDLMRANSAALLNLNLASTVGPSMAGFLVQVLSAPFAIIVDAASYVVSAVASSLIREPARAPVPERSEVRLSAGLRVIFGDRVLTPLAISAAVAATAGAMQGPLIVLVTATWHTLVIGGQAFGAAASGRDRHPPDPPGGHRRHAPRRPDRPALPAPQLPHPAGRSIEPTIDGAGLIAERNDCDAGRRVGVELVIATSGNSSAGNGIRGTSAYLVSDTGKCAVFRSRAP
ncbi:MFS transporter [Kribbella sp. CWNU-51]